MNLNRVPISRLFFVGRAVAPDIRRERFSIRCVALAGPALLAAGLFPQGNSNNAPGHTGNLPGFAIGNRIPLPVDWSFGHVIYTQAFRPEQAAAMANDPRLYNSWALQGHVQPDAGTNGKGGKTPPPAPAPFVD